MGGDGGSIPKRSDVVRTSGFKFVRNLGGMGYSPNTQVFAGTSKYSRNQRRSLRYSRCAITQEPLKKPVCVCRFGNLYNKESLLLLLLKKSVPKFADHIKSLKDIRDCKADFNEATGHLVCPITKRDLDGGMEGYVFWRCGCIVSEAAMKNMSKLQSLSSSSDSSNTKACLVCGKEYKSDGDLVRLIPDEEVYVQLRAKYNEALASSTNEEGGKPKKSKKRNLEEFVETTSSSGIASTKRIVKVGD